MAKINVKDFKFMLISIVTLLIFFSKAQAFRVGLVLDKGGKDDKSFNSAAYEGAQKALKEKSFELKYVEATDNAAIENLHRSLAQKKFDLIIGVGFAQTDAVRKISKQFPETRFVIIDGEIDSKNVKSILFEEQEGSFLVGAIAAMTSKTNKIGFIGGMDIPLIRRFAMGYKAGAQQVKSSVKIVENYIGVTGEAWNNPAKAKELALAQYGQNIDVIFAAAGASNTGVFDAAEDRKKYAIGVDSNQNWMKPGFVLTSMLKRVDQAVYSTITDAQKGIFEYGILRMGLKNSGVDYSMDAYNDKLVPTEIRKKVDALKQKIISGEIVVPDYYKLKK